MFPIPTEPPGHGFNIPAHAHKQLEQLLLQEAFAHILAETTPFHIAVRDPLLLTTHA